MNDTERKVAADLLDLAAERFSRHVCNDFSMPNTDEAWAIVVGYHEWNGDPQDCPERPKGPLIYTADFVMMHALARRLRGEP